MARRKRPDRRFRPLAPVARLVRSAGELIARHPSSAGGLTVFAVTFTVVAINAIFHQPGEHPSPLYETRAPSAQSVRLPAIEDVPVPSMRFAIDLSRYSDPQSTASIPRTDPRLQDNTVHALQRAMYANGLYDGDIDGVFGPRTANSIRAYQRSSGLQPTGRPTEVLLVHMTIAGLSKVAVPQPKPQATPAVMSAPGPTERIGERQPQSNTDLIADIQRGLSNIAYDDVRVDGVIGKQTSEAIADFQRHYRLPVTGNPDRIVLQKLREIGAL
ncbi:MAG: peptidoglycan-binding domain-containing protein [Pseudomonadota bacterium]